MTAIAVQASARRRAPRRNEFYKITHRIADRMTPKIADAFSGAVFRLQKMVDQQRLRAVLSGKNLSMIEAAAGAGRLQAILLGDPRLLNSLRETSRLVGAAGADVLSEITGMAASFNAFHPDVVLYARNQAARLVVGVGKDVKEAIRIIVAMGSGMGLTPMQQAKAIAEVVGLPPNWAKAPLNFADELRRGVVNPNRLFRSPLAGQTPKSVAYVKQLKNGIAAGKNLNPAWVAKQQTKYTENLIKRRALNIARTESMAAAVHGQTEGWKQAVQQGVLPKGVRRICIVTPDDRLRKTHAAIPGLNPRGVGLIEPFKTPMGPKMNPPFETLCRCGVGLTIPRSSGGRAVPRRAGVSGPAAGTTVTKIGKKGSTISAAELAKREAFVRAWSAEEGFPAAKAIVHATVGPEIRIGSQPFRAAATYEPTTGRVNMYSGAFNESDVRGIFAHEVQHAKWDPVWKDLQRARGHTPDKKGRWKGGWGRIMDPNPGEFSPQLLEMDKLLTESAKLLRAEDGVSPYSAMYWNRITPASKKAAYTTLAINETLAEIARIRVMSKLAMGVPDRVFEHRPTLERLWRLIQDLTPVQVP